jgi:hypothetical protein
VHGVVKPALGTPPALPLIVNMSACEDMLARMRIICANLNHTCVAALFCPQSLATPPQWPGQEAQVAQVMLGVQGAVLLTPPPCQWLGPAASQAPPLVLA